MRESSASHTDLVTTIAKGSWAQDLARAFCLEPDEYEAKYNIPLNQLPTNIRTCIENRSIELAHELVG